MSEPARYTARPATAGAYALGEGPVWDADRSRLLWVDIVGGTVHEGRLDPAAGAVTPTGSWSFGGTVGAVAVTAGGELLVAERHTLTRVGADGARAPVARVLPDGRASRLNDGAVDPAGRFLVGSLAQDRRRGEEILVRLDAAGVTVLDADLDLSNGLAWSPAGDRFYSVDTVPGLVRVRDYDPGTGAVGPRRDLFSIADGYPDGMCVDADGNLWIAVWGGARVECRDPGGDLLAVVAVDAPHTSSVAFAGPDLDVLVVTTATAELSPRDLARHPDSGRLFTARVGARGLPAASWDPACAPSS
ncbi:SMP-30/gluconolactonase/LRE family protein [Dactylosporangium sp. NPDC048998]|uniref:SMP-30/gluconolactonase/LRE family protein n=1 Tax=Dactylosporangium sp. NPDC048998 TaxID=3363976 RepID=UPI003711E9CF